MASGSSSSLCSKKQSTDEFLISYFFVIVCLNKLKIYFLPNSLIKLTKITTAVILTFICCWMPFLTDVDSILQVLHRLFPFARGLFEV